jgi:hypothetical protein
MNTCQHCGRDIVRTYVGGIEGWGHATSPGPNHHIATPVGARRMQESGPHRPSSKEPASSRVAPASLPAYSQPDQRGTGGQ